MIRPLPLLVALALICPCVGCAQTKPAVLPAKAPGRYFERFVSGGNNRSYILRVPRAYDGTRPLPLVVALHGWLESARVADESMRMGEESEKGGFVMVAPNGLGNPQGWNAGFIDLSGKHVDDVAFINALIDRVETEVGIDPDRVYVAGYSNGAFLAHLLGSRLAGRLAAIAAVAGTVGVVKDGGGYNTIPEPTAPISVLVVHGRQDRMVQYDSHSQALLRGVGALDSARWWAQRDGCTMTPSETVSSNRNVVTDTFSGGKNGTEVAFVSIVNGTHQWPGGLTDQGPETATGVNAADLVWNFFAAHPKHH